MKAVRCCCACLVALGLLPSLASGAESATARMSVSALVLPHARLETLAPATPTLTVTEADVANGYVRVAHRYTVRTNAPGRVRLRFEPRAAYAEAMTVEGFGAEVSLNDEAVELSPAPGGKVAFSVRLRLAPGFTPGEYPLPVHVLAIVD